MRNPSIDLLKAIAAYFVIFIHFPFPGILGDMTEAAARAAVPLFFLVSGYFCFSKEREKEKSRIPRKAAHILKLTAAAGIFYFLWEILWRLPKGEAADYIQGCFRAEALKNFLFYNYLPIKSHLWFLPALFYCYVLWYLTLKYRKEKTAYVLLWGLLLLQLCLGEFSGLFGLDLKRYQIRNFLLIGFPFFAMGNGIHRFRKELGNMFSRKLFLPAGVAGTAIAVAERLYWGQKELFAGSILAAFSFFCWAVFQGEKTRWKRLEQIGCGSSLFLYLFHPAVGSVMQYAAEKINISGFEAYGFAEPLLVSGLTTLLAVLLYKIQKKRADT